MAEAFNISGALRFDVARGRIIAGATDARVLIPVGALFGLCAELNRDALSNLGASIGIEAGRRAAARLARDVNSVSTEEVLAQLGAELALMGLGSLALEFWSDAMVFTVTDSPLAVEGGTRTNPGDALLASVLAGALQIAFSRELTLVPVSRDGATARFCACSGAAAEQLEAWLDEGCHFAEALSRLNEPRSA